MYHNQTNAQNQKQNQFYSNSVVNNNQLSPNGTLTANLAAQHLQQHLSNMTFSSNESNFTYTGQNLSGNGLNQSQQSYIRKNDL